MREQISQLSLKIDQIEQKSKNELVQLSMLKSQTIIILE